MHNLEHDEICELKKQRIAETLEQHILDTILSVLDELSDRNIRHSHPTCHKFNCSDREHAAF